MSVDSIKAPASAIQSTQTIGQVGTNISQADMGVRIIALMQGICSLLIIIGIIAGIIYIIKSKKTLWKKIIIGGVIILLPIIINWVLSLVKFNMLLGKEDIKNNINTNMNSNSSSIINNNVNNNKVDSNLWLSKYKNLPLQKTECTLKLFGNEQTDGLTSPIELAKLNEHVATYKYYPYNSIDTLQTSSLKNINDNAVSTIYARDEYSSLLFMIELYGEGLSFRECIEKGKFLIKAQGDLTKGSMNISASQIGLNIQNENKEDASKTLDEIINNLGGPTYIVANENLEQLTSNEFDISYKLIYKYNEYAIALYIEEEIEEDEKTCEIKYIYYYPIEFFNNLDMTENNYFKYRLK